MAGDCFCPEANEPRPALVLCHGFKGFKNWGFFPFLGRKFAAAGFYTVLFNFSHNGIGAKLEEFSELDRFQKNCFAFERADLKGILEQLRAGALPHAARCNSKRIGLLGHSRGGAAVLGCGDEAGVRALGLLAAIARYPALSPEQISVWEKSGVSYVENARTHQQLPLGRALLKELRHGAGEIEKHARELRAPVCIVHGEKDASVPVAAARLLAEWIGVRELHILPDADHTFGARHPFVGETPELHAAAEILVGFFERELV